MFVADCFPKPSGPIVLPDRRELLRRNDWRMGCLLVAICIRSLDGHVDFLAGIRRGALR